MGGKVARDVVARARPRNERMCVLVAHVLYNIAQSRSEFMDRAVNDTVNFSKKKLEKPEKGDSKPVNNPSAPIVHASLSHPEMLAEREVFDNCCWTVSRAVYMYTKSFPKYTYVESYNLFFR